MKRTRS